MPRSCLRACHAQQHDAGKLLGLHASPARDSPARLGSASARSQPGPSLVTLTTEATSQRTCPAARREPVWRRRPLGRSASAACRASSGRRVRCLSDGSRSRGQAPCQGQIRDVRANAKSQKGRTSCQIRCASVSQIRKCGDPVMDRHHRPIAQEHLGPRPPRFRRGSASVCPLSRLSSSVAWISSAGSPAGKEALQALRSRPQSPPGLARGEPPHFPGKWNVVSKSRACDPERLAATQIEPCGIPFLASFPGRSAPGPSAVALLLPTLCPNVTSNAESGHPIW